MPRTKSGCPDDDSDADPDEKKRKRLVSESEIRAFRDADSGPRGHDENGVIGTYRLRHRKCAAFVDLRCETDFVAQHEAFAALADELAMHVAVATSRAASVDELVSQAYEPDLSRGTVADVLDHASSSDLFGERIRVARFDRWTVG